MPYSTLMHCALLLSYCFAIRWVAVPVLILIMLLILILILILLLIPILKQHVHNMS